MNLDKLRTLLDEQYDWPALYQFKFVAPADKVHLVKSLFKCEVLERPSKTGKYISITVHYEASGSSDILEIYSSASKIEGIVSL